MPSCSQPPIHAPRACGPLVADYLSSNSESSSRPPTSPKCTVPLNQHITPKRTRKPHCEANTVTPWQPSSSQPSAAQSTHSKAQATYTPSHIPKVTQPAPAMQPQMDIYIESEMCNAIFQDPDFVNHFLPGNEKKLDTVLEHCHASRAYDRRVGKWKLPKKITCEPRLYHPVLKILNTIKSAVHTAGNPSDPYEEPSTTLFQGRWSQTIPSDEAETAGIKPDLVLFEDVDEHWESVQMAVKIKKLPGQCRKLHQDPRINSNFPRFFPKPICASFRSRDPGAYPCRVAALVSAKPPNFILSRFYQLLRSTFYLAGSLSITFLLIVALLWPDFCIVRCISRAT
jgi:hypothetical protein